MEIFEEQAITTLSYEPRIWKRYVDDAFTIQDRENVDDFLQHLNNQQPSIHFTMETEEDYKFAFLDTAVLREPNSRFTTSVYRKPTHTDQYLANLPRPQNEQQSPTRQRVQSYYGLPYVKGLCEQLRRCLQQQGVRAVFKSETTLRPQLVRPKDSVDQAKQDGVVYRIPCEYSKV
ncbi:uncharacterized protein [Pocillopora verrucosa]|uniref:uncharacterized protein n=1 Tax=Pocillopora verrucosa TaxID=203993 RepID=UPI003340DE9E